MNPDFLMVLPADVKRLGSADTAIVLALIRWRTEFDDGRHGRLTIDGTVWWRASYADISAVTGLTYSAARWHTSKLEKGCEVAVLTTFGGDDRTRVYRLSDQPTVVSDIAATSQLSLATHPPVVNDRPPVANDRPPVVNDSCTTYMRSREVETKEGDGADAPAPPSVQSSVIRKPQTAKTARKKTDKTPIPDGWSPTAEQFIALAEKYPALDIEDEFEAFILWVRKNGTKYVDWTAGFQSWVRKAEKYRQEDGNRNGYENNDDKILNGWAVVGTNNTRKAIG